MAIQLDTQPRDLHQTKGQLRQLRQSGRIPAIVYGQGKNPVTLSVNTKIFLKEMDTPGIRTRVFKLSSGDLVLTKELGFSPVKDTPLHIDFIRLGAHVTVAVPLVFLHEDKCPGIKRGGVLNIIHHEVKVTAPSTAIPHAIEIDLALLNIGQVVHIKDLVLPQDVSVSHISENEAVISIVSPGGGVADEDEGKPGA